MRYLVIGAAMIILGFASIFDFGYEVFVIGTVVAIAGIILMCAIAAQSLFGNLKAHAKKKSGSNKQLILYGIGELSMVVAVLGFLDIHFGFLFPSSDSMHWLLILPASLLIGILFLMLSYRIGQRKK